MSWEKFLDDCGGAVFTKNGLRARQNFEKKYIKNKVKWTGVFLFARGSSHASHNEYSKVIFVKMDPSDSSKELPDITIAVTHEVYERYKSVMEKLEETDVIIFSAEFYSLGDEYNLHLMILIHIETTGEKKPLEKISYYVAESTGGNLRGIGSGK